MAGSEALVDPPACSVGPGPRSTHPAAAGEGVPPNLTGLLVDDKVATDRKADVGAIAAGPGAVQVERRRGVRDVQVLAGEVAHVVLAVGAGVDHPRPLEGADDEGSGDNPLDVGDAGQRPTGVQGKVEDAVAVLEDLPFIPEALGDGRLIYRHGALGVLDQDGLDHTRVGMGRNRRGQGHSDEEAQQDDQKAAHGALPSIRAGSLPAAGRRGSSPSPSNSLICSADPASVAGRRRTSSRPRDPTPSWANWEEERRTE